jgi:hypothetical protein
LTGAASSSSDGGQDAGPVFAVNGSDGAAGFVFDDDG